MAKRVGDEAGYGWSRIDHDRRQARLGLELTPVQRLEWLERTMDEMLRLVGRAGCRGPEGDRGRRGTR